MGRAAAPPVLAGMGGSFMGRRAGEEGGAGLLALSQSGQDGQAGRQVCLPCRRQPRDSGRVTQQDWPLKSGSLKGLLSPTITPSAGSVPETPPSVTWTRGFRGSR